MRKGFFTQSMCLLTDGQTTIEHIKAAIQQGSFEIAKQAPAQKNWAFGGPSLIIAYLPKVNGYATVDVVNQPWPDEMIDTKSNAMIFGAWTMGRFGPFTYPGGLGRAVEHARYWRGGRSVSELHRGFIRIQITYVLGGKADAPTIPKNYDPLAELKFLSCAALALLRAPGVLCYFNPNGEILLDRANFQKLGEAYEKEKRTPLPLWINARHFGLSDKLGFMDTVGNGQLDVSDIEAIYPAAKYKADDMDNYVRNITTYLLGKAKEVRTGDAIDGPGETASSWTMEVLDEGVVAPPRPVLRLYPKAHRKTVREALAAIEPEE